MAGPYDPDREPEDIGSESPASEEAKEQRRAGQRGGPQQAKTPGRGRQPPQTSGRRPARHEQPPKERKRFSPEESPSAQGDGEPSPETLKRRQGQQGIEPKSGSHSAHGERAEEEARKGPPRDEHARHGRQHVPGRGDEADQAD